MPIPFLHKKTKQDPPSNPSTSTQPPPPKSYKPGLYYLRPGGEIVRTRSSIDPKWLLPLHGPPRPPPRKYDEGELVSRKDERDRTGTQTGKKYRIKEIRYREEGRRWYYGLAEEQGSKVVAWDEERRLS